MLCNNDSFFLYYDVEYMGVKCTGVRWSSGDGSIFRFEKDGEEFVFEQQDFVESNTEEQHVEKVIESQFLPWWFNKKVEDLQRKYDDLAKEFDRAINYIKMTKVFKGDYEE